MSRWLTRKEAAAMARVTVRTIDNWIKFKELRWAKIDNIVRIRRVWLDSFLREHEVGREKVTKEVNRIVKKWERGETA